MTVTHRALVAEFLGTALLLYVIVGSGIAVERLSDDGAIRLFAHAVAVGAGLSALIAFLAPVSGAHLNPAVTIGFSITRATGATTALGYVGVQLAGAAIGVAAANLTFGEPMFSAGATVRDGVGRPFAEFIGTFVLVLLILGLVRTGRVSAIAPAVGAWVGAIVVATASTGFANPAVTVARAVTDTFTGIQPASVPAFLLAQVAAGIVAAVAAIALYPSVHNEPIRATKET